MSDQIDTQPPAPPRMPRWVKALIAAGALIAVVIAVMAAAGGEHSPRRHLGGETAPEHTPPPGITHGEQP